MGALAYCFKSRFYGSIRGQAALRRGLAQGWYTLGCADTVQVLKKSRHCEMK